MILLDIKNLSKTFGKDTVAVNDFSLQVEQGEFVVLVGPSGCGKTTTLRMIAGLEAADEGSIVLEGRDIASLSPDKRDIAMIFQDYALYPHLSVFDNIAFPLKVRKIPKEEVISRVEKICETLGIASLKGRKPRQLSGGQRQRVAIARALIRNPQLFLMDEPLSNLDAKLRLQLRSEIAALHRDLKATVLYVTHDQTEAMTLADKIVVMDQGKIIQITSPQQLYDQPRNTFVAEFIGATPINLLELQITEGSVKVEGVSINASQELVAALRTIGKEELVIGLRPERMFIKAPGGRSREDTACFAGQDLPESQNERDLVVELPVSFVYEESLGHETIYHCDLGGKAPICIRSHPFHIFDSEDQRVSFRLQDALYFDAETRERLVFFEPDQVEWDNRDS